VPALDAEEGRVLNGDGVVDPIGVCRWLWMHDGLRSHRIDYELVLTASDHDAIAIRVRPHPWGKPMPPARPIGAGVKPFR